MQTWETDLLAQLERLGEEEVQARRKWGQRTFFLTMCKSGDRLSPNVVDTEMPHGTVATNHNSCLSSSHYPARKQFRCYFFADDD